MHIAVIGAGAAGICAAKYALTNGYNVVVFEQTKKLGGTWIYNDKVGVDEFGLNIHSSMYKGLHTNFPKELMGFPDYDFPDGIVSFVPSEAVVQFLNNYANNFNVVDHIKFQYYVLNVEPIGESQWKITVKNLPNNQIETYIFDAIIVCNGHFSVPSIPDLDGKEHFTGKQFHSHDYRSPEQLKGEEVLLIGAGFSTLDISYALQNIAKSVTVSHHQEKSLTKFPDYAHIKPDVKNFTETGVNFVDGTHATFTTIIYCTGYHYTFPFLSESCGIYVDDDYVKPLFKHCINITRPTMALIGLPFLVCQFHMFDLQVRFVMKYISGLKKLPSKEDMFKDTETNMQIKWDMGFTKKHAHLLGPVFQKQYFDDLSVTAEIKNLKPVISKIYLENRIKVLGDYGNLRKHVYKIIDDETYSFTSLA